MLSNLPDKDKKALAFIRSTLLREDRMPTLREINDVTGGKSPRSASIVIQRLEKNGFLKKVGMNYRLLGNFSSHPSSVSTIQLPLIGHVPCGTPVLAEENIQGYIPVSTELAKKGYNYFLLRATGNSMNKAGIEDGSILLVKQVEDADSGKIVVALIDDDATVKILEKTDHAYILRPKSTDPAHKPIVLTNNFKIQGEVVAVLPADLY